MQNYSISQNKNTRINFFSNFNIIVFAFLISFFFSFMAYYFGIIFSFSLLIICSLFYFFIISFEKMFLLFLIFRPAFDIIADKGIGVGYSALNLSSLMSIIFIISSLFFILSKRKKIILPAEVKFFLFFIFIASMSTFYNFKVVKWDGVFSLFRLAVIFFLMLIILKEFNTYKKLEKLFRYLLYSLIIPLLYGIMQIFTGFDISTGGGFIRINGGFVHANVFAGYLCIFILMIFSVIYFKKNISHRAKINLIALESVLFICLLLTYGRAAWLALGFVLLLILLFNFRKSVFILLSLPFLFIVLYYFYEIKVPLVLKVVQRFQDVSVWDSPAVLTDVGNALGWRLFYWKELVDKFFQSPIIGYGLGSVINIGSFHMDAHNNYIQVFFENGIGGIFYFIVFLLFLKRSIKGIKLFSESDFYYFYIATIALIVYFFTISLSGHLVRNTVAQLYIFSFLTMSICYFNIDSIETKRKPKNPIKG